MDMNQRCGYKGKSSSAAANETKSYSFQSSETAKVDGIKFSIIDDSLIHNVELLDRVIAFPAVSAEQLTDDSMKCKTSTSCNLENRDIFGTEYGHFPTVNVNWKIESLMASMKKSAFYGDVFIKMKGKRPPAESVGTLHQIKLASSCWLAAKTIIDNAEKMMNNEGLLLDHAKGIPHPTNYECKCEQTCGHACNISSGMACKGRVNNKLACIHKACCSFSPKFMTIGTESKTGSMSTNLRGSWTSLKNQNTYVLKESVSNVFASLSSTKGHVTEEKDNSYSGFLLGQKRLADERDGSDVCYWPCKSPKCSIKYVKHGYSEDLKCLGSEEDFQKFSSTMNYPLIAANMDVNHRYSDPPIVDSKLAQVKESAFSRTITIPTDHSDMTTIAFENFVRAIDKAEYNVGTHVIGEHRESSTKTLCVSSFGRSSSSLLGETFSWSQQDIASSNLRKSEKISASLTQQTICNDLGTAITDRRAQHPASAERSTCVEKADLSSDPLPENNVASETFSAWIERLQRNHSKTNLPNERFVRAVASTREQLQEFNLLHHRKEEDAIQPWIRRWCHNPNRVETENSRLPNENFEGKLFASVQAMALMGKAISNYRPCRLKRKEAFLVWNT
ncbi:hypothetical protein HPP92_020281 [Vanilla planifolia]|uniref:Uncharacterized protein n=1 Tax=Vanilla planifolia TaxID=51239 RepID=A0A835UJQ3_VANPL|nr:hypothetical protein HPP92_020281 [Vanilla planifolia]